MFNSRAKYIVRSCHRFTALTDLTAKVLEIGKLRDKERVKGRRLNTLLLSSPGTGAAAPPPGKHTQERRTDLIE